jgi:hypothetical protein
MKPPLGARLAALGGLLGGLYLWLFSLHLTYWILDLVFFVVALLLWLGRTRAELLIASVGIVVLIGIRHVGNRYAMAALDLSFVGALFLGGARWIEGKLALAQGIGGKSALSARGRLAGLAAAAAVFFVLVFQVARPALLMVRPERRRALLEALSPAFPIQDPATLSPLAARLRGHVAALAATIGERSAYQQDAQEKAKDYIVSRLRSSGYAPALLDYTSERKTDFVRTIPYRNIEALLGTHDGDAEPVWIVGAHYDSVPGTMGADDNASGVAVLLEVARLLKERGSKERFRFVAFDTEEPPSFGTRDMGSYRYASSLKSRGINIEGVLNLEMLGYFNSRPSSQLYPPFLSLFYPDQGDFIGVVGNFSSMGLLRAFERSWKASSRVPIEGTVLPSVFSSLALSDQLNFWPEGYRALMLSDTSFFRYAHYHQSTDTLEKLDYERMAAITEAVVKVLDRP